MEDRAAAIARDLAKASPDTIRLGFACVHAGRGRTWEEAGAIAAALREQCTSGADFKEGVEAFRQHREPHWPSMPPGTYLEAPKPLPEKSVIEPKP
jgi:enoyl-CoA hydratase/carnithine racemase